MKQLLIFKKEKDDLEKQVSKCLKIKLNLHFFLRKSDKGHFLFGGLENERICN